MVIPYSVTLLEKFTMGKTRFSTMMTGKCAELTQQKTV